MSPFDSRPEQATEQAEKPYGDPRHMSGTATELSLSKQRDRSPLDILLGENAELLDTLLDSLQNLQSRVDPIASRALNGDSIEKAAVSANSADPGPKLGSSTMLDALYNHQARTRKAIQIVRAITEELEV